MVVAKRSHYLGSPAGLGLDFKLSLTSLGCYSQQRQAQSNFAGRAGSNKRVGWVFEFFGRHTVPVVFDFNGQKILFASLFDPNKDTIGTGGDAVFSNIQYVK